VAAGGKTPAFLSSETVRVGHRRRQRRAPEGPSKGSSRGATEPSDVGGGSSRSHGGVVEAAYVAAEQDRQSTGARECRPSFFFSCPLSSLWARPAVSSVDCCWPFDFVER
jgi:hypothetical protein